LGTFQSMHVICILSTSAVNNFHPWTTNSHLKQTSWSMAIYPCDFLIWMAWFETWWLPKLCKESRTSGFKISRAIPTSTSAMIQTTGQPIPQPS
jgi:hypothetical protein